MPVAEIHLLEGRSLEQKRKLISEMTRVISESVDVKPEQVRIIIHEMPKAHFGIGGVLALDLGR
jgi:4-oxalocrotonate tautomerase